MGVWLWRLLLALLLADLIPPTLGSKTSSQRWIRRRTRRTAASRLALRASCTENGPASSNTPVVTGSMTAILFEDQDSGYWFANFSVGNAKNLHLLVDTGSADLVLNPNTYQPSSSSINTNQQVPTSYGDTKGPSPNQTTTLSVFKDTVSAIGSSLAVNQQSLGVAANPGFPRDGIAGFASQNSSALNASPWFQSLCSSGQLPVCRFGLALETSGTGTQYFGSLASSRFEGPLSTAPIKREWELKGDVTVNGQVVQSDAHIITDTGTSPILAPFEQVQAIFKAANIQMQIGGGTNGQPRTVDGIYPCNNPPQIGFAFPSASDAQAAQQSGDTSVSQQSTNFNIVPQALIEQTQGTSCMVTLHGSDDTPFWFLGQRFFQGRYVDHNVDANTMGFANLVS